MIVVSFIQPIVIFYFPVFLSSYFFAACTISLAHINVTLHMIWNVIFASDYTQKEYSFV